MSIYKENKFVKGTLSLSLSVILIKIIGVLFKVPLSYVLTDEGMGYFNSAYAIYGFFYILCTAGVPKAMMIVMSETNGKEASDSLILKTGLTCFAFVGGFSTLINIVFAPVMVRIIGSVGAIYSIIAISPSLLFVSLNGVLRGYLNSKIRLTSIAVSQVLEGIVKLSVGLSMAYLGWRLGAPIEVVSSFAITGITLGSFLSFTHLYIVAFSEKQGKNTEQKSLLSKKQIRSNIIKNAFPIALSASLLNLCTTFDLAIIIRRLISNGMTVPEANALYGNYTTLAIPMFNLVISVLSPIATSYMPRLAKLSTSGRRGEFLKLTNGLVTVTLFFAVPCSVSFLLYGFELLDVLFSVQSSAIGADMLSLLSLGICLYSVLNILNTAHESEGRVKISVISLLIGGGVKLLFSYLLIGEEGIGVLGAPIGTVASYFVSLVISAIILERNGIKTLALIKCSVFYLIGLVSFYPSYIHIYSTGAFESDFVSASISLIISFAIYLCVSVLVLLVIGRKNGLNCTKKTFYHWMNRRKYGN